MRLNIAGRFWCGYFLAFGLLLGAGVSHAAIYQMRVIYYVNGYVAGDVYLNASGNTSASLQDALTTTLEQSSLTSFACGTGSANKGLTITGPVASNAQMLVGYWCNFMYPDQASPMRAVYVATIATGQMTENVLTGTAGSGSTTEPEFDGLKASGLFAFFFSFIVGVWYFCKNIGLILNAVRRW